jgi:hypothetical protein
MKATHPASADARLQLVAASGRTRAWLAMLALVLPVTLALVLPRFEHGPGYAAQWIAASLQAQHWFERWIGAGMVLLVTGGLWLTLDCLLRRQRLRLDAAGMELATTWYTRRLSWSDLDLSKARVIDLGEHPETRPLFKSNGYALPGFRSGWFRARDFSRLFVATAGGSRLLRIPTRLGYALLLQAVDAKLLLERMRELSVIGPPGKTPPARGR